MASITRYHSHKTESYHYRVRVKRGGKVVASATFHNRKLAEQWARETEYGLEAGRVALSGSKHTLEAAVKRYRETVLPRKRPSTARTQALQLDWWSEHLGIKPLSSITPALIVEHRDKLLIDHAPATVVRYLAVLAHLFTTASREWQWTTTNPVRSVSKPREPQGRIRYLEREELAALVEACRASRNPELVALVVLAATTGARRGELLALRWADIRQGRMHIEESKNGTRRSVPLPGPALAALAELPRRIDGRVFGPGNPRSAFETGMLSI